MQISTNNNNEIIGYAFIGGFENGIELDDNIVPQDFLQNYKPKYYLYQNERIVVNTNYEEKSNTSYIPPMTTSNTSDEELRKMFASMQVQLVQANMMVMQLSQQNARLSQEMVVINQKLEEVTNNENVVSEV